jgi:trigger factor
VEFAGGKGENIAIVVGEGRMLPELEQGLIGAAAASIATWTVNFPADYRATELAGKKAIFAPTSRPVEEPTLPELDEEFCKAFGVTEGGVPKLREDVAANMRRELEQNLRNRNKTAVMEKLYQANPIDVPNALIEVQIRDMQSRPCAAPGPRTCRRRRRANPWSSRRAAASRSACYSTT